MPTPFSDITLYTATRHSVGTAEFNEEVSLLNFVSDLYVRKMDGYKPPNTTRITIQPAFHKIWNRSFKNGSIVTIAPYFSYDEYELLNKQEKYKHILNLIQEATIKLSEEYKWNKAIFEKAYEAVLKSNFVFKIDYPEKISRDKKKIAHLSIEKTETITSVYVNMQFENCVHKIKLLDKENLWWYDSAYLFAKNAKWFDNNTFGFSYAKGTITAWYCIEKNKVSFFENGKQVTAINFKLFFLLEES